MKRLPWWVLACLVFWYLLFLVANAVRYYGRGRSIGRVQGAATILGIMADQAEREGDIEAARRLRESQMASAVVSGGRMDRLCDRFERAAFERWQESQ